MRRGSCKEGSRGREGKPSTGYMVRRSPELPRGPANGGKKKKALKYTKGFYRERGRVLRKGLGGIATTSGTLKNISRLECRKGGFKREEF